MSEENNAAAPDGVFRPWGQQERRIYKYHDGTQPRAVDPIVILKKLNTFPGLALDVDLRLATNTEAGGDYAVEAQNAIDRIVVAGRSVFNVPDLTLNESGDAKGLGESEVLALVFNFIKYMGKLGDDARPLVNSPPATEQAASDDSVTKPS